MVIPDTCSQLLNSTQKESGMNRTTDTPWLSANTEIKSIPPSNKYGVGNVGRIGERERAKEYGTIIKYCKTSKKSINMKNNRECVKK